MAALGRPIIERLEQIAGQWADFADRPDARVLCWLLEPDEHAMIDAFVAIEDDERAAWPAATGRPCRRTCRSVARS